MERKFNIGDQVIDKSDLRLRLCDGGDASMFRTIKVKAIIETASSVLYQLENWSLDGAKRQGELIGIDDALEYALDHVADITKKIINQHKEVSK